jgi:hypothetical protein
MWGLSKHVVDLSQETASSSIVTEYVINALWDTEWLGSSRKQLKWEHALGRLDIQRVGCTIDELVKTINIVFDCDMNRQVALVITQPASRSGS